MTEKRDPELADDLDIDEEEDIPEVELPEYDHSQFELPDDYEFVEHEDGDDDGSEG